MMRWLKTSSLPITLLLCFILFTLIDLILAAFVNGPVNLHEHQKQQVEAKILSQIPEIKGLEEADFAYVTWQGYDQTTLYWFDAYGDPLTTRGLALLDYEGARKIARENGMEQAEVKVCYGYNYPAYSLEDEESLILLDFDTLEIIYQRNNNLSGVFA